MLKKLLTLAWPIVVSRASQTVVGLSDALMVAHLGASALAATSTGSMNSYAVLMLPLGLTFIVSSYSSQYFGKGDLPSARRYGWYGLIVAALTQVVALLSIPFIEKILQQTSYTPELQHLMGRFMSIRLLSSGAAIGIEALGSYYSGQSRTRPVMVANVVAMVLNVALNWVLIDGNLGATAMGVAGSATASAVATWAAFAGFFVYFINEGRGLAGTPLRVPEFLRMVRFGLPSGINWFFEFAAVIIFMNVIVAGLGTPALAALNSVFQLNSVAFMPGFALATAGSILVGQAIGADRKDEVPQVVRQTLWAGGAWQGLVGLVYVAIPSVLMAPFAKGADAEETLTAGVVMLSISAAWQLFDIGANVFAEAMRAAGDTLFPLVLRLTVAWAVWIPGAWVSVRVMHQGYAAAMTWMVIYLALLSIVLGFRFRSGAWRKMQLIDPVHV